MLRDAVIVKIFGWLSTNTDLPKKKGRIAVVPDDDGSDADEAEGEDGNQPIDVFAQKKVTISHSCMQVCHGIVGKMERRLLRK